MSIQNSRLTQSWRVARLLLFTVLLTTLMQSIAHADSKHVLIVAPTALIQDTIPSNISIANERHIILQTLKFPAVVTYGVPFPIAATWLSDGASLDGRWEVVYQLHNSDASVAVELVSETSLQDLLQADVTSISDEFWIGSNIAAGSYTISILVRDPAHEQNPLSLAMPNLQEDGSYLLGTVAVQAAISLVPMTHTIHLPLSLARSEPTDISRSYPPVILSVLGVENNVVLQGRAYIGVETSGSVDRMEFRLAGPKTLAWTENGAPWWFLGNNESDLNGWDTTNVPNGQYTLTITAIGPDSRTDRTERTFTVDNQTDSPSTSIGRSGVFISSERMQAIRQAVSNRRAPNYSAYGRLLDECYDARYEAPSPPRILSVPNFYEDSDGHARAKEPVKNDANNAYALALCYRITGNEAFARAATGIIKAWSTTLTDIDTSQNAALVWSYHFPAMIFAADLLRDAPPYTSEIHQRFTTFLKNVAMEGSTMYAVSRSGCGYKSGTHITNNWSDWGVVLSMSIGVFTKDEDLYNKSVQKWRSNVAIQIDDQGNLPIEGRRNDCSGDTGLHYTNYAMQPLTIAAEIAENNGTGLYKDWRYQRAVHRTAEVDRYPSRFPFYEHSDRDYVNLRYKVAWLEVARNHIPDANADWLMGQFRPVVTAEVIRYATVTHGNFPVR